MGSFEVFYHQLKKYTGNDECVVIPEGITEIKDYAFSDCSSLQKIIIPDHVTDIGDYAFYECRCLEEIEISSSVRYMGQGVFCRCNSLKKVVLPQYLTSVSRLMFYHCVSLEEVILPPACRTIGKSAFEKCYSLKELHLPETVRTLEDNAFDDCIGLQKLDLPASLETIGDHAFFSCGALRKLVIGSDIRAIGTGAFETGGRISVSIMSDLQLHSSMFETNWNMNWNFGVNRHYNGRNEDNYQLFDSYLENVQFHEWKPTAVIVLLVNYLETYDLHQDHSAYDEKLRENMDACLEFMIPNHRNTALETGVRKHLITKETLQPYFPRIKDRELRIRLMDELSDAEQTNTLDDLLKLL